MTASSDLHTSTDGVLQQVLALSVPLHPAITAFDEPGGRYALAGAPGIAFFSRDGADTVSHESSSPSPALVPVLDDLRTRHAQLAGLTAGVDNSHLPALLLLCLALADDAAADRFELRALAHKPTEIVALDEEDGRHDPELMPHDAALRAWVPLQAEHLPQAGVHPAILEFRFLRQRSQRFVLPT